jgi:intracellular septation protein
MKELSESKKEIHPGLKLALEMGPLIVFFIANSRAEQLASAFPALAGLGGPLFVATAFFMAATALALIASWLLTRALPLMPVVSGVVIFIFGALTLYLNDELFIKLKPTIINSLFGLTLIGGLIFKKPLLKYVLGAAFELDEKGWYLLTIRWALFFFGMAILNEIIWRGSNAYYGEGKTADDFWVAFKVWGNFPITIIFMAFQFPLINRHAIEKSESQQ